MLIFLYGKDTYRSREKLNEIIEHYKKIHKSGLNLKFFDDKTANFDELKNEIQSVSMFDEKKLIVLKNTFSNKNFKENFLKIAKKITESKDIILFYEEGETLEDGLFKFLKKYGKSQEFKPLEDQRLRNWIKKEFEKYQINIDSKALEQLINHIGSNLWQMSNEIKKLISYKKGQKFEGLRSSFEQTKTLTIEERDIELLVKPKIETDIFKTIDALASKNKKQALQLIHEHLEKGDSPLYLLSMINFQFRNLLIIRELIERNTPYYRMITKSNLHPLIVKKSYQQAKRFTFQQLKKIYQKIFETDLNIKTGKIEPETALDLLITEI